MSRKYAEEVIMQRIQEKYIVAGSVVRLMSCLRQGHDTASSLSKLIFLVTGFTKEDKIPFAFVTFKDMHCLHLASYDDIPRQLLRFATGKGKQQHIHQESNF